MLIYSLMMLFNVTLMIHNTVESIFVLLYENKYKSVPLSHG